MVSSGGEQLNTQLPAPIDNWREHHRLWEGNELERRWLEFCRTLSPRAGNWVDWAYCDQQPPWLDDRIFYPDEWPERSHLDRAEILGCPSPCELADSSHYRGGKTLLQLWQRWEQQADFDSGRLGWNDCWAIIEEEFDVLPESVTQALSLVSIRKTFGQWVANRYRTPRDLLLGTRSVVRRMARRPEAVGNPQAYLVRAVERESDFVEEEL